MNRHYDAALILEIETRLAAAEASIKPSQPIGERTKALASKQAWEKAQQLARRVIERGHETYRATLADKVAYARAVDATDVRDPRFTT